MGGLVQEPLPKQYEFSRLNLSHIVLSKRKLIQLVQEKHVEGWDDPRLPTLAGARRRGYSPEGIRLFAQRIGISKSDSLIDYSLFEDCQREVLNENAPRRIAVLNPLELILENYPENQTEECFAPNHPQKPEWGKRPILLGKKLWIEMDDFMENPQKGFRRLFVGNKVRLRYAYVIECTGFEKDENGNIVRVFAKILENTKSGTAGADSVKVKGNIHWLFDCVDAPIRLFDRLFSTEIPGVDSGNFLSDLNPQSKTEIIAKIEPALKNANRGEVFQFERHGYFVRDLMDDFAFNRTVSLKDSWKNPR